MAGNTYSACPRHLRGLPSHVNNFYGTARAPVSCDNGPWTTDGKRGCTSAMKRALTSTIENTKAPHETERLWAEENGG